MKNKKRLIKKWQGKLELRDWEIGFKIVSEFKRTDNYPQTGDIKFDIKNKKATVIALKGTEKNARIA
jgi:hypothetical protein